MTTITSLLLTACNRKDLPKSYTKRVVLLPLHTLAVTQFVQRKSVISGTNLGQRGSIVTQKRVVLIPLTLGITQLLLTIRLAPLAAVAPLPLKVGEHWLTICSLLSGAARFGDLSPFGLLLNHLANNILLWRIGNLATF